MKRATDNDPIRIRHMLDAMRSAQNFIDGHERTDLEQDEMLVFALVRALSIIGEAAANVTDETRAIYSEISWKDIIGMRNRVIHGYFNVDMDILWDTIVLDLPDLSIALEQILSDSNQH